MSETAVRCKCHHLARDHHDRGIGACMWLECSCGLFEFPPDEPDYSHTPTPAAPAGGETGLLEEARTWIPAKGPDCWLIEIKGNPYAFGHHWRPFWTFPSEIEAQGACDYLNALQSRIQEAVQLLRFILDENVIRHGTERANNFLDAAQQQEEDPA